MNCFQKERKVPKSEMGGKNEEIKGRQVELSSFLKYFCVRAARYRVKGRKLDISLQVSRFHVLLTHRMYQENV